MDESRGCQHSLPSIAGDIPDRSDYVSIDERQDELLCVNTINQPVRIG